MSVRARAVRLALLTILGCAVFAVPAGALTVQEDYTPKAQSKADGWSSLLPSHRFVTLSRGAGARSLRLTTPTRRHYAGRWLEWTCVMMDRGDELIAPVQSSGGDMPIRRTTAAIHVRHDADYCLVQVTVRTTKRVRHEGKTTTATRTRRLRQAVAVSAAGRAFVDRVHGAEYLSLGFVIANLAYFEADKAFPTSDRIVGRYGLDPLVALDGPAAGAPRGKVGLWTDGAQRLRVAYGLADGTQLFSEWDRSTKIHTTNADEEIGEINSEDSWWSDDETVSESSRG